MPKRCSWSSVWKRILRHYFFFWGGITMLGYQRGIWWYMFFFFRRSSVRVEKNFFWIIVIATTGEGNWSLRRSPHEAIRGITQGDLSTVTKVSNQITKWGDSDPPANQGNYMEWPSYKRTYGHIDIWYIYMEKQRFKDDKPGQPWLFHTCI